MKWFIKIHVAIDIKIKKIAAMSITKEDVYDGKMLKSQWIWGSENHFIKKVSAGEDQNSKDNFGYLDKHKIVSDIKVRKVLLLRTT